MEHGDSVEAISDSANSHGTPRLRTRGPALRGETWGCGGTCLDALRPRGPRVLRKTKMKMGHMGGSTAETIRQPRDRLTAQPQEREHSDAEGGTRHPFQDIFLLETAMRYTHEQGLTGRLASIDEVFVPIDDSIFSGVGGY
jgi:hypothetical protein